MLKRTFALAVIFAMLLSYGCTKSESAADTDAGKEAEKTSAEGAEQASVIPSMQLVGFIVQDDGSMSNYMMMHGFLRTAENLGYHARLYTMTAQPEADARVAQAAEDGCSGLLIPGSCCGAITAAKNAGMYVVSPYFPCTGDEADITVLADTSEYIEELARGIAERMTERSLKSGRILVYGSDTSECYAAFQSAVSKYYPQFQTVSFQRTPGSDDAAATEELAQFILNNRDIKGMYACDTAAAPIAVNARSRAISYFKEMDDKKTEEPEPDTSAAVTEPTPNPALLNQISITAFGCGLSDENLSLFNDNDIYALCIEPYYEAAATGVMMLDKLLMGDETAAVVTINRPIAYGDTIEKYLAIYNEVKELFTQS